MYAKKGRGRMIFPFGQAVAQRCIVSNAQAFAKAYCRILLRRAFREDRKATPGIK